MKASDDVVECPYCGYVNNVSSLNQDLEEFKREVRSWLMEIGVAGQSGADLGMRRLYFKRELYPELLTQFANIVGNTDDLMDYPLVYLSIYAKFPDLAIRKRWSTEQGKPIKDFARKLGSPELLGFVPEPQAQIQIIQLRLQAMMIPMLMDIVRLTEVPTKQSLMRCANTLRALADEIGSAMLIVSTDRSLSERVEYYNVMEERFRLAAEVYENIARSVETGEPFEEDWVKDTMTKLNNLKSRLAELSEVSVIDRVPMEAGLDDDMASLMTWNGIVATFIKLGAKDLPSFIRALENFANATFFRRIEPRPGIDQTWYYDFIDSKKFAWFVDSLRMAVLAREIKIIDPRGVATAAPFMYPFYLLHVDAILKTGMLWWKKGTMESFYVLVDAGFTVYRGFPAGDYPACMTPIGKKLIDKPLEKSLEAVSRIGPVSVPPRTIVLPPMVSPQDAVNFFTAAYNFREEAESARVEQGRIIEVPSSYKRKGFDPGRIKAVMPEVVGLYWAPLMFIKGHPELALSELGMDSKLKHRGELAKMFTAFLSQVKQ